MKSKHTALHINILSQSVLYSVKPISKDISNTRKALFVGIQVTKYIIIIGCAYTVFKLSIPTTDKVIIIAGLVALKCHFVSTIFFYVALILIIGVPVMNVTGQPEISNMVATYAFYMLCFGTLSAIQEVRHTRNS